MSSVAVLTERRLLAESGDVIFERGVDYVRYVVGLRVSGSRACASVQAKRVYLVELDWGSSSPSSPTAIPAYGGPWSCGRRRGPAT